MKTSRGAILLAALFAGAAGVISFLSETAYAQTEGGKIRYESPVFVGAGESVRPKEVLEENGKRYRLVAEELHPAVQEPGTVYASAVIPYALEGRQEPPEKAMITLKEPLTGEEYEREVPRIETEEKNTFWSSDFTFEITVLDYGADIYYLGEHVIAGDEALLACGEEFLRYLDLPEDCYRIHSIQWSGNSYEEDGVRKRDAVASGEKRIRNVEVTYGGQVETPRVSGRRYVGIYEEILPERETEETSAEETSSAAPRESGTVGETEEPEIPSEEKEGVLQKLLYWVREHVTVVAVSAGALLAAGLLAVLFILSGKKKRRTGD